MDEARLLGSMRKRLAPKSLQKAKYDSSDSQSWHIGGKRLKQSKKSESEYVSSWTTLKLDALGIHYESDPITIEELLMKVKSESNHMFKNPIPNFLSCLVEYCKCGLNFSLDVPDGETSKNLGFPSQERCKRVCDILQNFNKFVLNVRKKDREVLDKVGNRELFEAWCNNVRVFLNYYRRFVQFTKKPIREGHFQDLFMTFARIFFMEAENGNKEVQKMTINGKEVASIPDIRFPWLKGSLLVMSTNVKGSLKPLQSTKNRSCTSESDLGSDSHTSLKQCCIHEILSPEVTGQHGGELLLELTSSAFQTFVVGCVCIGTEIIFTYLDMTVNHYDKIQSEGKSDGERSYIHYTKPLNYLLEEDRNQCLDLLFWLGFIQTSGFESWYFSESMQNG